MAFRRFIPLAAAGLTGLGVSLGAVAVSAQTESSDETIRRKKLWDFDWDRREPESLVNPKDNNNNVSSHKTSKSKRILICVRHGQYNLQGQTDKERYLTELGREQADLTGKRLQSLISYYGASTSTAAASGDAQKAKNLEVNVIMSTMQRATETAQIILKYLPESIQKAATKCDMIREGAPIEPVPPIDKSLWNPDPHEFHSEGMRIEAAFRKYFHRADPKQENDSVDVLVCHGNVIRYFLVRALQFPPEAWLRLSLHNGSITVFTIFPNGRVVVTNVGDTGHFPIDKMTLT